MFLVLICEIPNLTKFFVNLEISFSSIGKNDASFYTLPIFLQNIFQISTNKNLFFVIQNLFKFKSSGKHRWTFTFAIQEPSCQFISVFFSLLSFYSEMYIKKVLHNLQIFVVNLEYSLIDLQLRIWRVGPKYRSHNSSIRRFIYNKVYTTSMNRVRCNLEAVLDILRKEVNCLHLPWNTILRNLIFVAIMNDIPPCWTRF